MPIIDLIYTQGALNEAQQKDAAARLTDIIMEIEGTKGDPRYAAGTWLTLNEVPSEHIAVGGQQGAYAALYRVIVYLPQGVLSVASKSLIVERITDALLTIEGAAPEPRNRARVYCLVTEVTDGGWGFGGVVYTLEALRAGSSAR
jgi:phenylpyruvate tautomerase PptA (4-oxalocrotonate tautomerase family)